MIGLGKTIEVEGGLYEIVRTLPIPTERDYDKETTDFIRDMWLAEKVFKSDAHGQYFFVREVQDVEWEEITD
jgi:hypothetical protein